MSDRSDDLPFHIGTRSPDSTLWGPYCGSSKQHGAHQIKDNWCPGRMDVKKSNMEFPAVDSYGRPVCQKCGHTFLPDHVCTYNHTEDWLVRLSGPAPEQGTFGIREQMFYSKCRLRDALNMALTEWESKGWEVLGVEIEAKTNDNLTPVKVLDMSTVKPHDFNPGYSGMTCQQMVMRNEGGDSCNAIAEHPIHHGMTT